MSLRTSSLLMAPIYVEIRSGIALSRYGWPFLLFPRWSHYIHLLDSLTLYEPICAPIPRVDQVRRREHRLGRHSLLKPREGVRIRRGTDGGRYRRHQMGLVVLAGFG